jgi:hypothetical protein
MIVNPARPLRRLSLLATLFLGAALPGAAHADKYAGAFMENGGGARALGMGAAFTAVADDPSTTFWNPAGLADVSRRELLLMHSERFGDLIDRDFVAYVQPVSWRLFGGESSGIGVSLIRLGVDDIPFTNHLEDQLDDNGDGTVDDDELLGLFDLQDQIQYKSDQELGLLLSYGEQKGDWRFGGSLKFVRQSIGPYSSLGVGADLALLRPAIWKRLDFGLKLQDVTTTYLSWSTGHNEIISPAVIPGLAWRQPLSQWDMDVTLAASIETRFDNRGDADQYDSGSLSFIAHTGMEVGFSKKVFVRTGFDGGFDAGHFAAGAGFRLDPFMIDYAYAGDALEIDEITHRISVSIRF